MGEGTFMACTACGKPLERRWLCPDCDVSRPSRQRLGDVEKARESLLHTPRRVLGPDGRPRLPDDWHTQERESMLATLVELRAECERLRAERDMHAANYDNLSQLHQRTCARLERVRPAARCGTCRHCDHEHDRAPWCTYHGVGTDAADVRCTCDHYEAREPAEGWPDCVRRWREHAAEGDHESLLGGLDMNVGECVELDTMRACLEWLATAPWPPALSSEVAEAVRDAMVWCKDPHDWDGIPHVCALLDALDGCRTEAEVREAALEEAAKVAHGYREGHCAAIACAIEEEIRALKGGDHGDG